MDQIVQKKRIKNFESRLIGILAIFAQLFYLYAIIKGFNTDNLVISVSFLLFQLLALFGFIIHIINHWTIKVPERKVIKEGFEQRVAVIIPTWSEPAWMVKKTVLSVVNQDYPIEKLVIVVSDDAKSPEMLRMVYDIAAQYPKLTILYNNAPAKGSPYRQGEGKAGNLNSAFKLIQDKFPDIEYIETRDADDLVGSMEFLRDTVGQLMSDPKLAYVQTIKKVITSKGDPFGNREDLFFKSTMLYKNGANAAFPCGSGLVWKKAALLDIGGFPTWNMVEDVQSGIEALKRGWDCMYLPITGALGQISPEDIPNMYKQRGTWAMDAFRYLFWGDSKGLSLRQKLQFAEGGVGYFITIFTYFYAFLPAIFLMFGASPVKTLDNLFLVLQFSQILGIYLFRLCIAERGNTGLKDVLKTTQTGLGNVPAFIKALILTLVYGPNRKPNYKVTRKSHKHGIYLLQVLPQLFLVVVLITAVIINIQYSLKNGLAAADVCNLLWAVYFIYMYKQVVINSVFKWTEMFKKNTNLEETHPRYEPQLLMRLKS